MGEVGEGCSSQAFLKIKEQRKEEYRKRDMFLTDNVASVVDSYCFSLKGLLGNAILPLNPAGQEHFRLGRGGREHLLFLMWDLKERKRGE